MIQVRRFEPKDQEPVVQLISGVMEQEFRDLQSAYPFDDLADIQDHYHGLGEAFFVAVNSRGVIGTLGVKKEDNRIALLRRLFVAPAYRKQNVGKKLLEKVLSFCDEAGYEEAIFKATSKMEGALKMLQKHGFIQRAKIQLGEIELLKFSLLLPSGKKKIHA